MNHTNFAKCAVVTGGTGGIGAAIAGGLAHAGCRVIVVGRSRDAGEAVATRLRTSFSIDVRFEEADLSSLRAVEDLAARLLMDEPAVDVLVNCAAGVFDQRRVSADGIEYTFALNHLGPLSLTLKLAPLLRNAAQARVINVAASPAMLASQPPDLNDLEMRERYSGVKAYMRSKNLNVMMTYELAKRVAEKSITFNAYHPGIVRTQLSRHLSIGKRFAVWLAQPFLLSPTAGADTGVWLGTSNDVARVSGNFFVKRQPVLSAPCTYNVSLSSAIWDRSLALLTTGTPQP